MEEEVEALKREIQSLQQEVNKLKINAKSAGFGGNTNNNNIDIQSQAFWDGVEEAFRSGDIDYIKGLIRDKTIKMFDTDPIGRTLLIIAAKNRFSEIVELCLNLGAAPDHRDKAGMTALDHARNQGWYRPEQILLFNQKKMNKKTANKIREDANTINKQKGFIGNILNELSKIGEQESAEIFKKTAMELMINFIHQRLIFSDDFLNLCWQIASNENEDALESELWAAISSTCSDIINNGNKRDLYWFKTCIVPSTIWYKKVNIRPMNDDNKYNGDDDDDDDDKDDEKKDDTLIGNDEIFTEIYNDKSFLYYHLLKLVNNGTKDDFMKLEKKLKVLASKNTAEWETLCNWHNDDRFLIVRNDSVPNSLEAEYSYSEISKFSEGKFDAAKFYDFNGFLTKLVLLAQSVDIGFQESVQNIFTINKRNNIGIISDGGRIIYRRGPVKLIEDARIKAERDYFDRKYPTSACILDFNRCELICTDTKTLLIALDLIKNKIENGESGCIIQIVRDKNGFRTLNVDSIQQTTNKSSSLLYGDIKINVLIRGKQRNIVGEIVFILGSMLEFKGKANKFKLIHSKQLYIENSLSKILPILLDDNRQLINAANSGDVAKLLSFMVTNNKKPKDLIKTIKSGLGSFRKRTILHSVSFLGHYKIYVFLKQTLSRERFIVNLFVPNEKNQNPIEYSIKYEHDKIFNDIFRQNEVIQRYEENTDDLFRIIIWAFGICQNDMICNKVLERLNVGNEQMIQLLNYQYPEPITNEYKYKSAQHYHKMKLLNEVIANNTLKRLKKLISMIGDDQFIENIFIVDGNDQNGLEIGLINNKLDIIEYILSIQEIQQQCIDDDDILYRVVCGLNQNYNEEITQYVLQSLQLKDENKLNELNVTEDVIQQLLQ